MTHGDRTDVGRARVEPSTNRLPSGLRDLASRFLPTRAERAEKQLRATLARRCRPLSARDFLDLLSRTGFSERDYRDAHADLVEACPDPREALLHFFRHGIDELRLYPLTLDLDGFRALAGCGIEDQEFLVGLLSSLVTTALGSDGAREASAAGEQQSLLATAASLGARPYVVIGDSHSHHYRRRDIRGGEWLLPIHLLCSAGSAMGLDNPSSQSGYGRRIGAFAETWADWCATRGIPILLKLGQVDVEFVYNFKRIRDGRFRFEEPEFHEFCRFSTERYFRFLSRIFPAEARSGVHVLSVHPPALSDEMWRSGYVNAHVAALQSALPLDMLREGLERLDVPDLPTRTRMHAFYNMLVEARCDEHGFRYVDDFSPFVSASGTLDPRFIPRGRGRDHHLEPDTTREATTAILWDCVTSGRRTRVR